MDPRAMEPHGLAMQAFFNGDTNAELLIRRDDGQKRVLPVSHFFRDPLEFTPIENAALEHCRGHVLDVGAGSGLHSLVLQKRALPVTSIDISPQAVEIMRQRGVNDAHCADIFEFRGGRFDTLLMMGHGVGIVETITGLDLLLPRAYSLLSDEGQVLLDSLDVRITDNRCHLAYHEANRKAGRYFGENRIQFEFQGKKGPYCGWLHVDPESLKKRAEAAGWRCEVILGEKSGEYLAKLEK